MDSNILLFIIKLVLGGLVAFFAILLMSKTRDTSWMLIVSGFILSYIALVYDLLCELGVFSESKIIILGIPLIPLLCIVLPSICFIVAFIIMFLKK